MPLQETSGAASYDAFGGGVAAVPNYIEDVFSTWLYTGSNASPTVVSNGIDLAGKGGMVWLKGRSGANSDDRHELTDTVRGVRAYVSSNNALEQNDFGALTTFSSDGFTLGTAERLSRGGNDYVSWTFREQPKFFDVVTYSGSNSLQNIQHNLGSVPGCIIIKRRNSSGSWFVYHRSLGANKYMTLNTTSAEEIDNTIWNNTSPTSTQFTVKGGLGPINESGGTYVAYLFAHDSGGFGLTGTDNVISCGSFVDTGGSGVDVNLGYEPQWVLIKAAGDGGGWHILDNMRGWDLSGADPVLYANLTNSESTTTNGFGNPTATGFSVRNITSGFTCIYIAIRRGPMKVPTTGASVFTPIAATASAGTNRTVGFPADLTISQIRDPEGGGAGGGYVQDRLRGYEVGSTAARTLRTFSTDAEAAISNWDVVYDVWNRTARDGEYPSGYTNVWWHFGRAPQFFDEVCYTGTGSSPQNYSHNLRAIPEMMIVRRRNQAGNDWFVYHKDLTAGNILKLNTTASSSSDTSIFTTTAPTASVFTVGGASEVNSSAGTYVWYGFASCPGVSKVGSYTGTGTTQTINCGFIAGARFVLIKRTDSTGDWYVWDSARGIVAGNDPYLLLNSTAAEVTNTDFVDTAATGFEISSTAPAAINANGGTFIFLAIA